MRRTVTNLKHDAFRKPPLDDKLLFVIVGNSAMRPDEEIFFDSHPV